MNVKQLRKLIADMPDNTEIVVGDGDHSYRRAEAEIVDAETDGKRNGYLGEYYSDEDMTPGYKKIVVLYVG